MKIMVFDVGGTEIKYSVMDEQMHRTDSGAVPTPQDTQAQFLDTVYRLYAPHKDEVSGIAMALPGFVDNRTGYVSNGGALLYNTATPVGQLLAEKCGCPVILENDGKAAAMAELANGALKDCCNAAVFIIGTGVGGGIIANGQLVRGVHFTAGEYSFVNTNAEAWDAPDQNMACQCSTSNLLKWYRARKALPEDAPLDGRSFFAAANGQPHAHRGRNLCGLQCRGAGSAEGSQDLCPAGGRWHPEPAECAGCGKGGHRRRHQQAAPAAGKLAQRLRWTVRLPGGTSLHGGLTPLPDRALRLQQRGQSGGRRCRIF